MQRAKIVLNLDFQSRRAPPPLTVRRLDSAWQFVFDLYNGGTAYPLDGCRVSFQAIKADGTSILDWCKVDGSTAIYNGDEQLTAAGGMAECKLCVYGDDGKRLSSKTFFLSVEEWREATDVSSTTEVPLLESLIENVRTLNVTADGAAERAEGSAARAEESKKYAVEAAEEVNQMFNNAAKEDTLQEIRDKLDGYKAESPTEDTQKQVLKELEAQSVLLSLISKNAIGDFKQYSDLRNVIRAGLAGSYLNVGDQVVTPYAIEGGSTYQAPWDVKHIAEDGVYLGMHYAIPDDVQFDAPEAIYYAKDGLETGTYHIAIGCGYGKGWVTGSNIQFTLAQAVPAGGQVFIDFGTNADLDPTSGRAVRTYAAIGASDAIESTTTSSGTDGTSLGTIGAVNAHKTNGQLNAISRTVYGNGRYSESAIRQWLNSEAAAKSWWKPTNNWDRPPRAADLNRAGFLTRLPKEFVAILDYNDIVVALNTTEGFSTDRETVHDRVFLPSTLNLNIDPQLANAEGPVWDYYKALSDALGLQEFAQWQTYEILKHYNLTSAGGNLSPVYVWLRSAHRGYACLAWYVNSSGLVDTANGCNAFRSCPACKIKKLA